MLGIIRRYLIAGILFWVPIWITLLIFKFLIELMDNSLKLLPATYQPDHLLGFHIPGLGLIFTLVVLFITGMLVANFIGRRLTRYWTSVVARIPVVRSVYLGVQKVLETVFNPRGKAFRKVLLVEYPRRGLWSVAFQTSDGYQEVDEKEGKKMVTIFVPTTPNPTSGFLMMIAEEDVHELRMSIDEALKFVISLGVVQPIFKKGK
jgi:uncharacterized membrane protein